MHVGPLLVKVPKINPHLRYFWGLAREDFSDIQVRLPGGKMVRAHRLVLAASSPVLRSKFSSEFRDSSELLAFPSFTAFLTAFPGQVVAFLLVVVVFFLSFFFFGGGFL